MDLKWLSVELSLLLLVSMVAFAGFVSLQSSSSYDSESVDEVSELSGQYYLLRTATQQNELTRRQHIDQLSASIKKAQGLSDEKYKQGCVGIYQGVAAGEQCCYGLVARQGICREKVEVGD